MRRALVSLLLPMAAALPLTACGIPQEVHDQVVHELDETRIALAESQREKAEQEAALLEQLESLQAEINALESDNNLLAGELAEVRGDLELYESRAGTLEEALAANRSELDQLREARRQTEERLKVYRDIASQLASMIEAGQLSVSIRDGRMVINLADDILFDSGRTDIKDEGQQALQELAAVLQDLSDRSFLVAGHTDNIPIRSGRFNSNWELSTARAVEVVQFLQNQGVQPNHLAAAGYGEFDPIADNDDPQGRALNRRIEIILMPNISEMPAVPEDLLGGS